MVTTDDTVKIARVLRALEDEVGKPEHDVSGDPVGEIVATILSQNTTSANSRKAYADLIEAFPTWARVRDASHDEVMQVIRSAGLAETKTSTILNVLGALPAPDGQPSLDQLNDMDDDDATAHLVAFNGVGVKTATCVLVFALGRDVCPVDTHVHRVANRLGFVDTKTPDRTYSALRTVLPDGKAYDAHVLLVRFGRTVCKARSPVCNLCPIFDDCAYEERHAAAEAHSRRAGA